MPAVRLPVDERSVGAARSLVRKALDGYRSPTVDDAVLMVSELVSNAVRHTEAVLLVLVRVEDGTLRVEVSDDSADVPRPSDPGDDTTSGRGLGIVDTLAAAWGVIPNDDGKGEGKMVWFEVQLDAPTDDTPAGEPA